MALDQTGLGVVDYYAEKSEPENRLARVFTGEPIDLTPDRTEDVYARGGVSDWLRDRVTIPTVEEIAEQFHYTYEALAPSFGWSTQAASRTSWEDLPATNKALMTATISALLARGIIHK